MQHLLYIDPGSGSYLVQIIIAGALGLVFFFKNIGRFFKNVWLVLKSYFVRSADKSPEQPGKPIDN